MSIAILGGGTYYDVAPHFSLCTRAFGSTAMSLHKLIANKNMPVELILTKMADSRSTLVTNIDIDNYTDKLLNNKSIKVIIFNVAMCDFTGRINGQYSYERLSSKQEYQLSLLPDTNKVLSKIKKVRPDILVVGFKTTYYSCPNDQIQKALEQINVSGGDLVLANDIGTRNNVLLSASQVISGLREDLLLKIIEEVINYVAS